MNFEFTEEQREYRKEIIKFAKKELNKEHDYREFSREMWKKTAEFGLFALNAEEKYGGLGEDYLTMALILEAMGYGCEDNGFIFVINNHLWVAQNLIQLFGSEALKEKYLSSMIAGDCIGCFAITEAEAGSDPKSMLTTATENEDGVFTLNGSKMFISNGPIADVFIVAAKTKEDRYTIFVVEKDYLGLNIGKTIHKMGLESCPFCELNFDGCVVPKENVLGKIDAGSFIVDAALEWERCFEFASNIGTMQRIMEQCIAHGRKRRQGGKPISEYQGVSHKIAKMKVAIEMSRNMLYKIAWMKDQEKNAYKECAVFKLFVSENYVKTCQNALQIFGGYGYTTEYCYERELRDALGSMIYSGTSDIQKNIVYELSVWDRFHV